MSWSDYVPQELITGEPEYPTIVSLPSSEYTSRKRRACDYCGAWIEVGERYRVHKWTEDGEFQTAAQHADTSRCVFDEPKTFDDSEFPF